MKLRRLMSRIPPTTTAASAQSGALVGSPPAETTRRSIGARNGSIFARENRATPPKRFTRRVRTAQSRRQNSELLWIIGRSVIRGPRPTDCELVEAKHIHHSDGGQRRTEKIRTLRNHCADEKTSIRSA